MRITIVGINYAPEVTGIAPYNTGLAEGLVERGHEVTVLTGMPHYPEWRIAESHRDIKRVTETINGVRVRRTRHFVPNGGGASGRIRMELSFGQSVARGPWNTPDVVIAVSPALLATAGVVARARLQRIPVGVIVQDIYSKGVMETGAMGSRAAAATLRFEVGVLRAATGIAAIHQRFADVLADFGVDRTKMTELRNWTHVSASSDDADGPDFRRRYGYGPEDTVVVHTGNMGAKQGLENVVEAAKLADAQQGSAVHFLLVGDGNQRAMLDELSDGVKSIRLVDPLPDKEFKAALAAADILLVNELPGVGEMAVPSKLTSYFIAGKPVIAATDPSGGAADELSNAGAGIRVEPGNPAALLDAVRDLAAQDDVRKSFASNGIRYVNEKLSAAGALDRYEQWCLGLAGAVRRSA